MIGGLPMFLQCSNPAKSSVSRMNTTAPSGDRAANSLPLNRASNPEQGAASPTRAALLTPQLVVCKQSQRNTFLRHDVISEMNLPDAERE
ncbi:hypothetical protein SKAU_G00283250 [Synaphobranchus kaupii]|uniref:Uncharacterized protein n=1 Tax=Synaphobranchus kaupii TaxID=118154 RepID=A0A9Q1EXG4_SYNKA|nr:hypothetical protein SKAU_G00283250 [Synaphobranchus kaupii]